MTPVVAAVLAVMCAVLLGQVVHIVAKALLCATMLMLTWVALVGTILR